MNRPALRHTVMPSLAALALVSLAACGASNENTSSASSGGGSSSGGPSLSGTLNGAGSSAQEAAMQAWQAGFQSANPDVTVNYDAIGSGGGREQFLAGGNTAFAGSDDYLSADEMKKAQQRCGGPYTEIPVYVSPIAIIYNLPGVDKLNLSPDTIGKIFSGDITTWNDPAIAQDNSGVNLPSTRITPVHRSDDSGTTGNFTDYLDATASSSWTQGVIETWPKSLGGEGADGTSGVVAAVKNGEGAIGYADSSQAGDLGKANVGVGGSFVGPELQAAASVLDQSTPVSGRPDTDLALQVKRDTSASGTYPVVLVSYQIACTKYSDPKQAALVKAFESYVISSDGQQAAAKAAGSAPISDALRQKDQAVIDQIATG